MMKHALREEFIQAIGLFNDVELYPNSVFYKGYSYPTKYDNIDLEVLGMLYNQVK